MKANDMLLVMRYMNNVWCEGVAKSIYGEVMGGHFWHKWADELCGTMRANWVLLTNMDDHYLQMLIDASLAHYAHLREE